MSNADQPSQQTGLNQANNPASQTSEEQSKSQDNASTSGETVSRRNEHSVPSTHSGSAQPSSLGAGDSGPLKQRDVSESDAAHNWSKDGNLDGEQMRAPGEGEVADAVQGDGGGGHKGGPDLAGDMDRKAKEHEAELHARGEKTGKEIEQEEGEDWTGMKADVDLGEALSGDDRGTKIVLAAEG